MKCPHCREYIAGRPCTQCGQENPEIASYCMACGSSLDEGPENEIENGPSFDEDTDLDFENRILCPDGTCTGIMVDGQCTECGKKAEQARKAQESELKENGHV